MGRSRDARRNVRSGLFGPLLLALMATVSMPASSPADDRMWRVDFQIDNDVIFGGEDRHYTSGLDLWVLPPADIMPAWITKLGYLLPPWDDDPSALRFAFGLRHEMYTPEDSSERDLIRNDRPYAGYLAARFSLYRVDPRPEAAYPYLDSFEIELGVVGPASLAEEGQDLLHVLTDSPEFEGWDNQLDNEPALTLRRARHWRIPGEPVALGDQVEVDLIAGLGVDLGNVRTQATASALLRVGFDLPRDFGRGRLTSRDDGRHPMRLYLFAGADGSVVARDVFLDGNTFEDSHDVDKRIVVLHAPMGVGFEYGRIKSQLMAVFNSEEFEGQDEPDWWGRWSILIDY